MKVAGWEEASCSEDPYLYHHQALLAVQGQNSDTLRVDKGTVDIISTNPAI